jgi:hypothetical protein
VEEIQRGAPEYIENPFTVAEIYQSLVPYRTHRDRLGILMNGDYEDALLRLLAGQGEFLILESEPARAKIRRELENSNPNTGIYREFAAVSVRLNPARLSAALSSEAERGRERSNGLQTTLDALDSDLGDSTPSPVDSGGDGPAKVGRSEGVPSQQCPDCSVALPDRENLRYCPRCGANLFVVPCRHCTEPLERGWLYCVACGEPATD